MSKSKSHANTKARSLDLFEEYRVSSDEAKKLLPRTWNQLTAAQVCRIPVWDGYAEYVSRVPKQTGPDAGETTLAIGTVLDYLGAALNCAAARFKATGDDSVKIFFTCLDSKSSTDEAVWLQKLRNRLIREALEDAKETGAVLDKSCTPIDSEHVRAMARALSLEGSAAVLLRCAHPAQAIAAVFIPISPQPPCLRRLPCVGSRS